MKRWIVAGMLGAMALVVLAALAFFPIRSERGPGNGNANEVPSDLAALTIHDRLAIQLTWTAVHQGTATYVLQRSEGGGEESWRDIAELAPGVTSYVDRDGLRDGVTYLYRIHAYDPEGGEGYSNGASAIATDLPRPTPQ